MNFIKQIRDFIKRKMLANVYGKSIICAGRLRFLFGGKDMKNSFLNGADFSADGITFESLLYHELALSLIK